MKSWYFSSFFLIMCFRVNAAIYQISSQKDFDMISTTIIKALRSNDREIIIRFSPGEYYCKNWHLRLVGLSYPNASVSLEGNNTILVGEKKVVRHVSSPQEAYSLLNNRMFYPWTELSYLKDTIEIVDRTKNLCRLLSNEKLSDDKDPEGKFIRITTCYKSYCYPIEKIQQGYIYFDAGDLCKYTKEATMGINADYTFGHMFPRYQLFGFNISSQQVYSSKATYCIVLSNTVFKSFKISGIKVIGFGGDGCFIALKSAVAKEHIFRNITFDNMVGGVFWATNSQNVKFIGCSFQNLYNSAITLENDCKNATIEKCCFENCGIGIMNSRCVEVRNESFLIRNNIFKNFGYGAIGLGLWYGGKKKRPITGIVEYNEIFYSGDYLRNADLHNLQDGGAIYTYTQSDGIDIRFNYIHDFSGPYWNRGIFCDDGAKNIHLTGNVVVNCSNSYAIDLRYCNNYRDYVPDFNTGNTMIDNIVSGKYRFEPRPENASTAIEKGTIVLTDYSTGVNKIRLEKAQKSIVKNIKHYINIKEYFK